jgi:uncharacterized protein (TIGR02300 family)
VAKAAWGTKRSCQSCGARFYDMRRDPIICPKCQAVYDPELALKARRGRAVPPPDKAAAAKPLAPPAVADLETADLDTELTDEDLVEAGAEEDEEDLIEDASELGEDDDMSKVIDKEEGEEEP